MGNRFHALLFLLFLIPLSGFCSENEGDYTGQNRWDDNGLSVIYHGRRDSKKIALTIDDGWVPDYDLLDYLEENHVPCTVFIPGKLIRFRADWIRRMNGMGFEICGHGYSHRLLPFLPEEEQRRELNKTDEALNAITGKAPRLVRPSGGRLDGPFPSLPVVRSEGYTVVLWDNDAKGYNKRDTVESQLAWLWEHLQPGNIILSHFGSSLHTREVLSEWIPQVREMGYEFVLVSELIENMEK